MEHLSAREIEAREQIATLQFPRLVCHANGQQSLVQTIADARRALELGATLLPTAPSPHDGGTPNHPQVTNVQGLVVSADVEALTLTALEPNTAVLGGADFTLHVKGTGFLPGAVIVFAGQDEPTTRLSSAEVTTGVNMTVWVGPDPAIPCYVRNPNGAVSQPLTFAFTAQQTALPVADDDEDDAKAAKKRKR